MPSRIAASVNCGASTRTEAAPIGRGGRCQSLAPTAVTRRPARSSRSHIAIAGSCGPLAPFQISRRVEVSRNRLRPRTAAAGVEGVADREQRSRLVRGVDQAVDRVGGPGFAGRHAEIDPRPSASPHTVACPPGVVTSSPTKCSGDAGSGSRACVGVVVIGDGDEVVAGVTCGVGERGRRQDAVAVDGVEVKGAAVPFRRRSARALQTAAVAGRLLCTRRGAGEGSSAPP